MQESFSNRSQIEITSSGIVNWHDGKQSRNIGWIIGTTFHCERLPTKHLHRKSNAYGFNYELLKGSSFTTIIIHLPFGKFLQTSRETVLRKGFFMQFSGFEKQIFLKVNDFGIDKEVPSEIVMSSQLEIF